MTEIHTPPVATMKDRHFLGIEGLSVPEINALLARAHYFAEQIMQKNNGHKHDGPKNNGHEYERRRKELAKILHGKSVVNLFFENSTRTRVSFEVAAKHLGCSVFNLSVFWVISEKKARR